MRWIRAFVLCILLPASLPAAKSLYFYSDINDPANSDSVRSILTASGVPFTELVLGRDARRHNVNRGGVLAVVDVDSTAYVVFRPATAAEVTSTFSAAPSTLPPPPAPTINPLVTKLQAQTALKNLLETNPSAWTQLMRDQAAYLLLLFAFRDLQNGTVY